MKHTEVPIIVHLIVSEFNVAGVSNKKVAKVKLK